MRAQPTTEAARAALRLCDLHADS